MTISQFPIPESGIPTGNTAGRPASPSIGDVYYNGQLGLLEIFDGTNFVACSAPPVAPTIATPTDASTGDAYTSTAGKLSVVFTPGAGGGVISQYNAFTTAEGHSAFSSGTTVTITGLTPGTAYTVNGNAQNNFGTSVSTDNATPVTPTTLPAVPTIGTATTSGATSDITVTWTLGNSGGKNLSAITVTPFLNGTTAQTATTAATTSSTSATIVGLTQGSSYTFKVKATNANGTSADSTATNSVTVPTFFNTEYLVIAGGGGGGGDNNGYVCGAGGAGGYLTSTLATKLSTNYTVTVGAGGAGGPAANKGGIGSDSVFSSVTSKGGGGGGRSNGQAGDAGGSGGGSGGYFNTAGGLGTVGQGNNGGRDGNGTNGGGGGGGAGAVGGNAPATQNYGGNGGNGLASSITGSSVTRAGGGGASGNNSPTGGTGGGGNGSTTSVAPQSGTTNLGGGGGGGWSYQNSGEGGAGGSGIVILRYLTADGTITIGAGLTGTTATDGSHKVTTITAGTGNVSWA